MKIIFYSEDVPIGGQEIMFSRLVNEFVKIPNVDLIWVGPKINKLNARIHQTKIKFKHRRLGGSIGLLFVNDLIKCLYICTKYQPSTIIVSQGTIEYGLPMIFAAKLLRINTISYIPLVQNLKSNQSKFFPKVRDAINRLYYRLPNLVVTISSSLKQSLDSLGVQNSSVLRNWVELDPLGVENSQTVIRRIPNELNIAVVGRVNFAHKNQDKILRAFQTKKYKNVNLFFIGSGPDENKLQDLLNSTESKAYYLGQIDNIRSHLSEFDSIIIGSVDEGVPLVMLEALAAGCKIVSFRYQSTSDYLPDEYLVDNQSLEDLLDQAVNPNLKALHSVGNDGPNAMEIELIKNFIK